MLDNATPCTAAATWELLQKFNWQVWSHFPYSPDLAPCDYHLFPKLKKEIEDRRFQNDEEVKEIVENFINGLGAEFYFTAFEKLVMRAEKYIEKFGDYVEK